jgi:hypothetical protein
MRVDGDNWSPKGWSGGVIDLYRKRRCLRTVMVMMMVVIMVMVGG